MSFPKCFFHPWPSILFTACLHFPFYVRLIFLHPYLSPPVTLCCVVAVNGGLPSPPMCNPRFWLAHPSTLKHHLYPFSATYSIKQKKHTWYLILVTQGRRTEFFSERWTSLSYVRGAGVELGSCTFSRGHTNGVLTTSGWGARLGGEYCACARPLVSAISSFSHFA